MSGKNFPRKSTEAELLYEKEKSEQRRVLRNAGQENPAAKTGRDPVRKERSSIRLELVIDQRFDGIPKEAFEQDQNRQALICHLVKSSELTEEEGTGGTIISRRRWEIHACQ